MMRIVTRDFPYRETPIQERFANPAFCESDPRLQLTVDHQII